ncbi:Putative Ulp1 protease family catalytic domain, papain-like cysteine peptidase superfamily [Colletotrichum destructivum]|uniref:Ulp1 protease family catalytic domain, papain-like cysteine peptidase superfamily n=1 Tax=Colletotrichum destructivum TaxID=34406 RepID=A0AAX4IDL3_9PEZI|nr:Putative Ulp1 protease family catalytic domain, papain-like cysteine peptidase superfamily [Colletotrichum destructivum]
MASEQLKHQGRPPPRQKSKTGYLSSFEELIASRKPRPNSPAPAKPTTFGYSWEPHPTSPSLLVNPGLDRRDPLAGIVAPLQLTTYLSRHYHLQFGQQRAGRKSKPSPNPNPRPISNQEQLRIDRHNHQLRRKPRPTSGRIEDTARAFHERPSRLIFKPHLDRVRPAPQLPKTDYSLVRRLPGNKSSFEDPSVGKPSTTNSIGVCVPPFPRSQQAEYLRRATTSNLPATKAACVGKTLGHLPALGTLLPSSSNTKARGIRGLKRFTPQRHARKDLFGPTGPISVEEVANTTPRVGNTFLSSTDPFTNPHTLRAPPGAFPISPEQPKRPILVRVADSSRTRDCILGGAHCEITTFQSAGHKSLSSDQGSLRSSPLGFAQSLPISNPSRKRRAEDSELDLIVANAADQSQPEQEPLSYTSSPASVASDEGIRRQGRATWLINIMTSVRGAVTKVSSSIAGYVYPRNYDVVERHSRDPQTGNVTTKRMRLELFDDSVNESMTARQSQSVHSGTSKTNLVWVDESTRVAHWHQVAPLVRTFRTISRRLEKGLSGPRDGSSASRVNDDALSQRIYTLGAYIDVFQQTAFVLESIYSHTFLGRLKSTSKFPQSTMDYNMSADEFLAITAAKEFVDNFPDECTPVLTESGVPPRVLKGIGADLDALVSRKPMPNLVQRAGLVGKVMSFFWGRDSFGIDVSDDPVSRIDVEMPGTFPDTLAGSESVEEAAEPRDAPECRPVTKTGYLPPVRTTDAYTFVREHLAEIAAKRRTAYKEVPPGMTPEDLLPRLNQTSILKKDSPSPVVLKRLQKARGLKRVQFSPSTKPLTPSSTKSAGLFKKLFRSPIMIGSPLRRATESSSLSESQTDGSPDNCSSNGPEQHVCAEPETDNTSEHSDGEALAARCKPRLIQHLNKSLNGLEAKGFFVKNNPREPSPWPPSPPTLAGLNISDDKEEELEDLSLHLQLLFDVDKARRREEEERKAREYEAEKLRKTGGLRAPRRRLVTSLPAEWSQKVSALLQASSSKTLAITAESIELKKHDFAKVIPQTEWLNDEIVNGSLQWVDRYVNAAAGATDVKSPNRICLAMGSFFYKRLEDNGVQNTERALRRYGVTKANFLKLETILMPICKNNHWTLLVVRPQKRTVSHMDSFNPKGSVAHTNRALSWVEAFLGSDYKPSEWRSVCHEAPQQTNGYDCGVFTITNGMCLALGLNAIDAYSGDDLPLQRLRLAGMLLNRGFSGEFDLAGL